MLYVTFVMGKLSKKERVGWTESVCVCDVPLFLCVYVW